MSEKHGTCLDCSSPDEALSDYGLCESCERIAALQIEHAVREREERKREKARRAATSAHDRRRA